MLFSKREKLNLPPAVAPDDPVIDAVGYTLILIDDSSTFQPHVTLVKQLRLKRLDGLLCRPVGLHTGTDLYVRDFLVLHT